jgi:hypothetical protein
MLAGRGFLRMTEFRFDPPLTLKDNIVVFTLDDAAAFVRSYKHTKWPEAQESVLRRLEGADSPEEQRHAADTFRGWAETEKVIVKLGL